MPPIAFPGKASDFLKIGVAAAARGDIEAVREILKSRPKWIHRVGSHGRTMLWEAAHKGRLEMVRYLVRRKADINACGTHYTPYFVEVSSTALRGSGSGMKLRTISCPKGRLWTFILRRSWVI